MVDELKYCYACSSHLPKSDFYKNKAKKGGLSTQCKACGKLAVDKWFASEGNRTRHKRSTVNRRKANKARLVEHFGSKCLDCQQSFPDCCYDFHHLDPAEKDHSMGNIGTYSWASIEKEVLGKCVMLCSNCHRIRHHVKE